MPSEHSIKKNLQNFVWAPGFVTVFTLALFYSGVGIFYHSSSSGRPSLPSIGHHSVPAAKHKSFKLHQKLTPPINIEVSGKKSGNKSFVLTAEIKSSLDTHGVEVEWVLPKWVKLTSGALVTTINDLPKNETTTVQVSVESNSEENQQIHVVARAPYGDKILSDTGQFNTTKQNKIRDSVKKLTLRNKAFIEKHEKMFK